MNNPRKKTQKNPCNLQDNSIHSVPHQKQKNLPKISRFKKP